MHKMLVCMHMIPVLIMLILEHLGCAEQMSMPH